MRTKIVTRYYCDHCNKGGLVKRAMALHEVICFKNPWRCCPICSAHADGSPMQPPNEMASLLKALETGGLQALSDLAENCPACIAATLAQHHKAHADSEWIKFDYKRAMRDYSHDVHSEAFP